MRERSYKCSYLNGIKTKHKRISGSMEFLLMRQALLSRMYCLWQYMIRATPIWKTDLFWNFPSLPRVGALSLHPRKIPSSIAIETILKFISSIPSFVCFPYVPFIQDRRNRSVRFLCHLTFFQFSNWGCTYLCGVQPHIPESIASSTDQAAHSSSQPQSKPGLSM